MEQMVLVRDRELLKLVEVFMGYADGYLSEIITWNDLMPVVEFIEAIKNSDDYEIDIFGNCCDIGGKIEKVGKTKIEATWLAVVEFIKGYNLMMSKGLIDILKEQGLQQDTNYNYDTNKSIFT